MLLTAILTSGSSAIIEEITNKKMRTVTQSITTSQVASFIAAVKENETLWQKLIAKTIDPLAVAQQLGFFCSAEDLTQFLNPETVVSNKDLESMVGLCPYGSSTDCCVGTTTSGVLDYLIR